MGNNNSSMLQDEEIELISEETGFSVAQIERLYTRFKSLDVSETASLSRSDFLRIPELAINPLCDRIVQMFFVDCDEDHERINFRQFMKVLATFRPSTRPVRSRNESRQESIQTMLSSLSQNRIRHSRHSSCDDFFNYYPTQHHLTNQHSVHYVASTNHLAASQFPSHSSLAHAGNHTNGINNNHSNSNMSHGSHLSQWSSSSHNSGHYFKKPLPPYPHLDPDEPANSRKQKLFFMFKVYDVDNDNLISLDDLKKILKMMVGTYVDEVRVHKIAERTLREADKNGNGLVDFEEFCQAFPKKDIDESLRVKFCNSAKK